MKGKEKCKILKDIRREIAKQNEIDLVIKECTHQGECLGTCPRCESEVAKLEAELDKRRKAGKSVALLGIAAAMIGSLTACDGIGRGNKEPMGDVPYVADTETEYEMGDIEIPEGDIVCFPDSETAGEDDTEIYELEGDVIDITGEEGNY